MSLPSRAAEAEARKADVAFQIALAKIGAGTLEDAIALWTEMDPGNQPALAADWLDQAIHMILTRRRLSRDLAMGYYRLVRALRTGKTIRDPFGPPEPAYVTIGTLRREFTLLIDDIDAAHPGGSGVETLEEDARTADEPADTADDGTERVPLEELPDLTKAELEAEANSEQTTADELVEGGPNLFRLKVEGLDETTPEEENRKAALRVARTAEKAVMNGGRGSAYIYGTKDSRVIAWVRVSLSGDPCHFCAMLISRGMVYKSRESAASGPGKTLLGGVYVDAYHDNCKCVAIPVYSTSQYETDPRFDQNRDLAEVWKDGGGSLKEWRRYFDERRREGDTPWVRPSLDSPAQAAG